MHKSTLLIAYSRLLADLAKQTDDPLFEEHHVVSEEWLLIQAPKLDKLMWQCLELQANPAINCYDITAMALEAGVDVKSDLFTRFHEWLDQFIWDTYCEVDVPSDVLTKRIQAAHQALVFCYKAEHEPSESQLQEAYRLFEENDAAVAVWDLYFKEYGSTTPLSRVARSYIGQVIFKAKWDEIAPKHGPGVVYPSKFPWEKSGFLTYYPTIDAIYPYSDWFVALPNYWNLLSESVWEQHSVRLQASNGYGPDHEARKCFHVEEDIVCRVQAVPKDSRGPRIICVHPSEAIWIQQGIRHVLENAIASSPLCRRNVYFDDQSVNGRLALSSSLDKTFCTLDLKDASDRLSKEAVRYLFGDYAFAYLDCCRASKVQIGDRVQELNKFAPMGNALTFPVQSLVYWAVVRAGIYINCGEICNDVFVFGDDIVFPSKYYRGVVNALTRFGLIVNTGKTFRHGSFRESCGVEAWNGSDITPLRLKVSDVNTASKAMAMCDLARRARLRGLSKLAAYLYSVVAKRYGSLAKTNNPDAQGLIEWEGIGWDTLLLIEPRMRFSRGLHRWEVPTKLAKQSLMRLRKHEWYHVQDSLMRLWREYDHCAYQPLELYAHDADATKRPLVTYRAVVDYSDRGTEYSIPYRVRLQCGWTEVIMK